MNFTVAVSYIQPPKPDSRQAKEGLNAIKLFGMAVQVVTSVALNLCNDRFFINKAVLDPALKALGFRMLKNIESKVLSTFCFQVSTCTSTRRRRGREVPMLARNIFPQGRRGGRHEFRRHRHRQRKGEAVQVDPISLTPRV